MAESPADVELTTIIDKLASYVARNGADFESMVKQREASNPRFAFLFGGPHRQYYSSKLAAEKAGMHAENSSEMQPPVHKPQMSNNMPASAAANAPNTGPSFAHSSGSSSGEQHYYAAHASAGNFGAQNYPPPLVQATQQRRSRFDNESFPQSAAEYPPHPPARPQFYPQYSSYGGVAAPRQAQYDEDRSEIDDRRAEHDYYANSQSYNAMGPASAETLNSGPYDPNSSQYNQYAAEHQRWSEYQQSMQVAAAQQSQQLPWNSNMPHAYPSFPHPGAHAPPHAGPSPFHGGFPPPAFLHHPPVRPEYVRPPPGVEPPFVSTPQFPAVPPESYIDQTSNFPHDSAPPPIRPRWAAPPPPVHRKSSDTPRTTMTPQLPILRATTPRPWWELPAGIFVDLVPKSAIDYTPLDADKVAMPTPKPITPDLLSALEQFYDPPQPDRPRNAEGWEKLGLFEHLKMKESFKKKRTDAKDLLQQEDLISKARQAAKELASKAAISLRPSVAS